jgi:molybdopterin molybdotransferase
MLQFSSYLQREARPVMLTVSDAQQLVLQHVRALAPETMPLSPAALGLVVAEDVTCDLDSPPHDKAMMDGYAVRSADLPDGRATLTVVEEITAGRMPIRALQPGEAARIMTGAPLPQNADAVVMIEHTKMLDGRRVVIEDKPPRPEQNILRRGREMRQGEVVVAAGSVLRPQEFGVLATVGRTSVGVIPAPRVVVLVTGDELVEPELRPGPGQIRNSNGPMLLAQTARAMGLPRYLGIARDTLDSLQSLIHEGLQSDVLLLSGGVSAGKLDLVPSVLVEAGVVAYFHKVEMKPGKPVFFGARPRSWSAPPALVFGLPGNPVSSFACFELFVRPALRKLRGHDDAGPRVVTAILTEDYPYRTDRPTYHPAWLTLTDEGWRVKATPWFGSPDLRGLLRANALIVLPAGDLPNRAGQAFSVLPLEETG